MPDSDCFEAYPSTESLRLLINDLKREYYALGCEAAIERIKQRNAELVSQGKLADELDTEIILDIQADANFARKNRQDIYLGDFLPKWR